MEDKFQSIAKSTLADEVAQRIAEMIHEGVYEPGDRLPTINEMASRFEVGHPTLREALKKLEAFGTLTVKHGSGVYVEKNVDVFLISNPVFAGKPSKDMMIDLIEARIPLELKSAGQAAENATADDIERLEELLMKAKRHLEDDSVLNQTNMTFHREVAVASGNVVIAQLLEVMSNLFEQEQRTLLKIHGSAEKDHSEHLEILDAIRSKDKELAQERMHAHLKGVREILKQWDPEKTSLS